MAKLKKIPHSLSLIKKLREQNQLEKVEEQEALRNIQRQLQCLPVKKVEELFITQDDDGDNMLMIAIIEGCTWLANCLIQLVPSPNLLDIRNQLGQTTLHLTIVTGQYRLARKIVLAGGSLLVGDFFGNTALHVACSRNDIDSVISLTKVVISLECPFEMKRQSLQVPQPSEIYNYKGETCVHMAVKNGYTDLVMVLVETRYNADVNAAERLGGKTILHLAAELGNIDLVRYLLSLNETNLHALTYSRHSALDLALGSGQHGVVEVLRHAGAERYYEDDAEDESGDYVDEVEKLSIQDFCFSENEHHGKVLEDDFQEYDDIRIGGQLFKSFL